MNKPFLIGKKVYLRQIEESDLNENYKQWFNDEEVCRFNSHHRFPNYGEDMRSYYKNVIKSNNNLILAIVDKETEEHIGNISLQNISSVDRSAELAIIIGSKEHWGQGVGFEACRLIVTHGFTMLNLHRIFCGTSKENKGMQKLAEKLCFKQEGIAREALFKNGSYRNIISYGLLAYEYQA